MAINNYSLEQTPEPALSLNARPADLPEHCRLVVEATPSALMLINRAGLIILLNAAAEKLFGYSRQELLGQKFEQLIPERLRAKHAPLAERFYECPRTRLMGEGSELFGLHKNGSELPLEIGLSFITSQNELFILASIVDVSKRKLAEKTLRDNQERLALVIQGSSDGIWDWNVKTNEVYFSPRWKSMLGFEEHEIENRFSSWEQLLHPEDRARALATIEAYFHGRTPTYEVEHRLRHKDGTYRWILARGVALRDAYGTPVRMAGSHVDLTLRKEAEDRLRQANTELAQSQTALQSALEELRTAHENLKATQLQLIQAAKLESIGTLAAGVAHEVKNPLQTMLMGLFYIQKMLPPDDPNLNQVWQDMKEAVDRADAIVRELLHFSASTQFELKAEDINFILQQALHLTQHEMRATDVTVQANLASTPVPTLCDKHKLEQVFINLILNAVQAMASTRKALLQVHTRSGPMQSELPGNEWLSLHFRPEQLLVMVEFEDNGPGIPEQLLSKIFDPFFTTKPAGKGTGLGLSVVKRIISLHKGAINVRNIPNGGLRVTIALQAAQT